MSDYQGLLKQAELTFVLPGDRAYQAIAYESADRTILNISDILLAVWDGGASAGRGATELVEVAAREGLPIIAVDAKGEIGPRLLWSGLAEFPIAGSSIDDLPPVDLATALPGAQCPHCGHSVDVIAPSKGQCLLLGDCAARHWV